MQTPLSIIALTLTLLVASPTNAQRSKAGAPTNNKHYAKHTFKASDGTAIDCWFMSPAKVEDGKKYPLVLALHGRGGNTTAATVLGSDAMREKYPCFVLAPTSTKAGLWASPRDFGKLKGKAMLPAALEAMISFASKKPVDKDRIYVTGQSMGGFGTFGAIATKPKLFAAAIPICGGWDPRDAATIKDIPLWVFHGDKDKTVPTERSRQMIDAIKKAGGTPQYTELKGVGHNSWSPAYGSDSTWEWLFKQRRKP